ncbi:hypothetical protein HMPREF0658_1632 [Hoylesella marshii DSM 16973 = JCM 13450]|uniref:Uncharacterized protein n=1 Tax=Hoylesella marshii DSM 16973 = JCM 13450 TaxID=862515 RepID=E0NTX9_9BACT|nr:hypothetical protein HMPREF0658_1632 [Hoylesella marshii DSM 16973 = JCM 13450]
MKMKENGLSHLQPLPFNHQELCFNTLKAIFSHAQSYALKASKHSFFNAMV